MRQLRYNYRTVGEAPGRRRKRTRKRLKNPLVFQNLSPARKKRPRGVGSLMPGEPFSLTKMADASARCGFAGSDCRILNLRFPRSGIFLNHEAGGENISLRPALK